MKSIVKRIIHERDCRNWIEQGSMNCFVNPNILDFDLPYIRNLMQLSYMWKRHIRHIVLLLREGMYSYYIFWEGKIKPRVVKNAGTIQEMWLKCTFITLKQYKCYGSPMNYRKEGSVHLEAYMLNSKNTWCWILNIPD